MDAIWIIIIALLGLLVLYPVTRAMSRTMQPQEKQLSDFFTIDIEDIFRYSPTKDTQVDDTGSSITSYLLHLSDYELGTFYEARAYVLPDGRYNLMLTGKDGNLTPQLTRFINFAAHLYGIDRDGKREITSRDYEDAQLGIFSRWYDGHLIIDNIGTPSRMNMTLKNLTPRSVKAPEN